MNNPKIGGRGGAYGLSMSGMSDEDRLLNMGGTSVEHWPSKK